MASSRQRSICGGVFQRRAKRRHRLALAGEEQRIVPQQDADLQVRPPLDQGGQERSQLARQIVVRLAGRADQRGPAVDVPADDVDAVAAPPAAPCAGCRNRRRRRSAPRRGRPAPRARRCARAGRCVPEAGASNLARRTSPFVDPRSGVLNPFRQHGLTWLVAAGSNALAAKKCHFASARAGSCNERRTSRLIR